MRKNMVLTLAKDEMNDVMGGWICLLNKRATRYSWAFSGEELETLEENGIVYDGEELHEGANGPILDPIFSNICNRLERTLGAPAFPIFRWDDDLFNLFNRV